MHTVFIVLIVVYLLSVVFTASMTLCMTRIGEKGRRNTIIWNIAMIISSSTMLLMSAFALLMDELSDGRIYILCFGALGILLLVCTIVGIRSVLRESPEDLIAETLFDVKIRSAGGRSLGKVIYGVTGNGTRSSFVLHGPDKAIAKQIAKDNINQVTVVYHKSNRRIHEILTK